MNAVFDILLNQSWAEFRLVKVGRFFSENIDRFVRVIYADLKLLNLM